MRPSKEQQEAERLEEIAYDKWLKSPECEAESNREHHGEAAWCACAKVKNTKLRDTQNLLDDQIERGMNLSGQLVKANVFVEQLNELRAASDVRFFEDSHVEVCGDWTGWYWNKFTGPTIQGALAKAHAAFKEATK